MKVGYQLLWESKFKHSEGFHMVKDEVGPTHAACGWHSLVPGLRFAILNQVFLATDNDAAPIICFLLQEQKKLQAMRPQTVDLNDEILFDIRPDMSWSIAAIAVAPVIVTHPRIRVGQLPHRDVIVLASENTLLLYIFRCTLRGSPSSSLANDCITGMAEGLTAGYYNHFVALLWDNGDNVIWLIC